MLVVGFPAAAFGTNCYVVAPAAGEQCVVIDPGIDVVDQLDEVLGEHGLQPVAVLLTHGHLDHTFSVTPVCGARGIAAWIHPGDRKLLEDPMLGLGPGGSMMFGGRLTWTEPDDVKLLADDAVVELAGLKFTVDHAPGHTPGSVMFRLPPDADVPDQLLLSGDVLFEGSIGRTDLPGGSHQEMMRSLARKVLPLPDGTIVLPGHGGATTIGTERATNPYLAQAAPLAGPHRGL
ncbi:MAG TPA: MBL fold metallo-hydrolase [Sporichthyaceae bacterium]|nr:MBL fold metallo-hydrolase [Sporichthyaceae bacterium]